MVSFKSLSRNNIFDGCSLLKQTLKWVVEVEKEETEEPADED